MEHGHNPGHHSSIPSSTHRHPRCHPSHPDHSATQNSRGRGRGREHESHRRGSSSIPSPGPRTSPITGPTANRTIPNSPQHSRSRPLPTRIRRSNLQFYSRVDYVSITLSSRASSRERDHGTGKGGGCRESFRPL